MIVRDKILFLILF